MATNVSAQSVPAALTPTLVRGAIAGALASLAMAMFAMIASVTYQHGGFFTPLFHISALVGSPASMMRAMAEAMAGHKFWFTPGAALVGAMIHMMTGAMFGAAFAAASKSIDRRLLVPVGAAYGVLVFVVSSFVMLPLAAAALGGGDPISDMASMVGYPTFLIEHVIFGAVLGLLGSIGGSGWTGRAALSG